MKSKKMKRMSKSSKKKVSSIKLSNKHLNKLGKQKKLNKSANKVKAAAKKKEKSSITSTSDVNDDLRKSGMLTHQHLTLTCEEEVNNEQISDEAIEYFADKVGDSSFVFSLRDRVLGHDTVKKKQNKRKSEDSCLEEDYECVPRKQLSLSEKARKMILPIKTKKHIISQYVDAEDEPMSTEEGDKKAADPDLTMADQRETTVEQKPLPVLSGVEFFVQRQQKLQERKQRIAALASAVVANPEENMKKLRELVSMLQENDPDVFVTVRKYVMLSLLEVFNNVIPGYYIRLPTDKEKHQKMKKETKAVLDHEIALVRHYKEYLEFLDSTAKGAKNNVKINKKKKESSTPQIPEKSHQALLEMCVKCLCELLIHHPNFNYCNNIITVVVPYMNHRNVQVSDPVCDCVKRIFNEDKAGDVTLELTKCIGRMIKARDYRVQPKVLETFLSLRIKEVSYTDPLTKDENDKAKIKKHTEKMSRRERKRNKTQVLLEKGLEESRATMDKKQKLRLHTETIQTVFLTYFRILKKATNSVLMPCVLEGLAKFAHLINVDFFDDLFTVFNKLIASGELSYRESLHCVKTAFTILSGQGLALNIDPVVFYQHLYKNLFHVHAGVTSTDLPIVLDCLDIMISKRKRQVSQQRVLAFLKRLAIMSLQQTSAGCGGLLSAIRTLLLTYNYTDILLENESQGSGVYLPDLNDPEHCNAQNAFLFELTLLHHHFDPTIRKFATHLCHRAPTSGEGQISIELRKQPVQVYTDMEKMDIFNKNIPKKCKSKHKLIDGLLQADLTQLVLLTLDTVKDCGEFT